MVSRLWACPPWEVRQTGKAPGYWGKRIWRLRTIAYINASNERDTQQNAPPQSQEDVAATLSRLGL